jgi:hypothetical protein
MDGNEKKRHQDDQLSGVAFGAPSETTGTSQRAMTAHIVIMPGGVMLVDTALDIKLGRPVSGPIHCDNGRD